MVNMNAYQQYRKMQTETATRGDLIVMLYEGAIKFLNQAKTHISAGDVEGAHNALVRSEEILAELMSGLDMSVGDVALNLYRLYDYMGHRLIEANCKKEEAPVDEVIGMLRELLGAWQQAIRQYYGQERVKPRAGVAYAGPAVA